MTSDDTNVALVDMDGTLCDYTGALVSQLNHVLEDILGHELTQAELWEDKYDRLRDMIKSRPGFWYNLKPINLGFRVVNLLTTNGFNVHVLTKGPYRTTIAWTEKVNWCRDRLPNVPVTVTENKSLVYGKILFDDYPSYCEAWLKWRPRGLVLMPAYEYNKGFDYQYPDNVIRVTENNLSEVEAAIKRVAARKPGEKL